MESLFNKYGAANTPHAVTINRKIDEFVDIILESFPEYPVHEIEQILVSSITVVCAEKRLKRSMALRKQEREAAKQEHEANGMPPRDSLYYT